MFCSKEDFYVNDKNTLITSGRDSTVIVILTFTSKIKGITRMQNSLEVKDLTAFRANWSSGGPKNLLRVLPQLKYLP